MVIWTVIIVLIGLAGGYLLLMIFSNMEKVDAIDVFFGRWIVDPSKLNRKGRFYRGMLFVYWGIVALLVAIFEALR